MRVGVVAAVVAVLVLPAVWAQGEVPPGASRTVLTFSPGFDFSTATLLVGNLTFEEREVARPGFVGVRSFDLVGGRVLVCNDDRSAGAVVPRVDPNEPPCRGGIYHDNPSVTFGGRTGIVLGAAGFRVERFPAASMSLFVTGYPGNRSLWATTLASDGVGLSFEGENLTFKPVGTGARVVIASGSTRYYYNGTDFRFQYNGTGTVGVRAEGFYALAENGIDLRLVPGPRGSLREALAPLTLLNLQEAVAGPEGREPVRNLTALVGNFTRIPALLNGGLVGRINGTVEGTAFPGGDAAFVRLTSLSGRLEDGRFTGDAAVAFAVAPAGFAPAGGAPSSPPWVVGIICWSVAALGFVLVKAPDRRVSPRWWLRLLALPALPLALLAWDAVVLATLGASAGRLYLDDEPRGSVAAFAIFELAGFVLAFLLVGLPVRYAARRVLARYLPRWTPVAGVLGYGAVALTAYLVPFSVLALGFLVARL